MKSVVCSAVNNIIQNYFESYSLFQNLINFRVKTGPSVAPDVLDKHQRPEMEASGRSSCADLRPISVCTRKRVLKDIVPIRV